MTSTHDEQALAAAYVLGALDAAERQAFESHLRTLYVVSLGGALAAAGDAGAFAERTRAYAASRGTGSRPVGGDGQI